MDTQTNLSAANSNGKSPIYLSKKTRDKVNLLKHDLRVATGGNFLQENAILYLLDFYYQHSTSFVAGELTSSPEQTN